MDDDRIGLGPPETGEQQDGPGRRSWPRRLAEYVVLIAAAVGVAFIVQAYLIKPFAIPPPSMATTVRVGDRVIVDRVSYHFSDIDRGDVVVFTGHGPIPLLKRVVGLPGDRLEIRGDQLFVNGRPETSATVHTVDGRPEPTLPGPDPAATWSLQRPFTVPAGQYFVMGDNRTDSADSRYWGTVRRSEIVGQALLIYWPPGHIRGL
jgi:signal peptidase I